MLMYVFIQVFGLIMRTFLIFKHRLATSRAKLYRRHFFFFISLSTLLLQSISHYILTIYRVYWSAENQEKWKT